MNSSPRPLVFALLAALATGTLTTAADPEPDWETTIKYLKKYIEEDGTQFGNPKTVAVTADQKAGSVTITSTGGTAGEFSWKVSTTICLKNVDPESLSVDEGRDFRDQNPDTTKKVYRITLTSAPPTLPNSGKPTPCVNWVREERSGSKPSQVEKTDYPSLPLYFTTMEAANRAGRAFRRAIALARQADALDPFADKPKPGAPPAGTTTGPSAAARRKAELEILDLKEKIEKQTKALEAATKAVDDCKQELQKLADLRAKETNEGKRRVIAAARLVMLTQQQEAETKRAACEVALRASKAELERREKALAGLRD